MQDIAKKKRAGEDAESHANRTVVTRAVLGGEAGLIGAARLAMTLQDSQDLHSNTATTQLT